MTFYEEIAEDAGKVLDDICMFAGLSKTPEFKAHPIRVNQTQTMRFPQVLGGFRKLRHVARRLTYHTAAHRYFQQVSRGLEAGLIRLMSRPNDTQVPMSEATREFLRAYYYDQGGVKPEDLSEIIGRAVPWKILAAVQEALPETERDRDPNAGATQ